MNPIEPTLDHLVYAVPDLAAAIREFEGQTGLVPADGGRHVGRGTRNYLVGLGPTSYLEIIGPDLEHPADQGATMPFGLDRLSEPRLLTWATHPVDIGRAALHSAAACADLGEPVEMSRRTPTGTILRWVLASVVPLPFAGVTPFLIDWGDSVHPAADPAIPQATLLEFTGTHPNVVGAQKVLAALEVLLPLTSGPPALQANLDTPHGVVRLG